MPCDLTSVWTLRNRINNQNRKKPLLDTDNRSVVARGQGGGDGEGGRGRRAQGDGRAAPGGEHTVPHVDDKNCARGTGVILLTDVTRISLIPK